jgi:hypothetical protein
MLTLVSAYLLWERGSRLADDSPEERIRIERSHVLSVQTLLSDHMGAHSCQMHLTSRACRELVSFLRNFVTLSVERSWLVCRQGFAGLAYVESS